MSKILSKPMDLTLRPHPSSAPALIAPLPRAQIRATQSDVIDLQQLPRPLGPLPKLPALPPASQKEQAPQSTNPSRKNTDDDISKPGASEEVVALRKTFAEFRTSELTQWQKLAIVAVNEPASLFTTSVREIAPNWSDPMVRAFLYESNFERWSLLPSVAERAGILIESRNGPLKLVESTRQVAALDTSLQYSVRRNVEADADFAKLKSIYGSRYSFHGSRLRNWHQILTQGLEPKSGTALQANGARNGSGVYVATASSLSVRFMGKTSTRVIGLVEVINHPSIGRWFQALVVPSKVFIALRYIAVYDDGRAVPKIDSKALDAHFAALDSL